MSAHTDLGAQPVAAPERFWLSAGVGVGAMEEVGPAIAVDGACQRGAQLFVLHATGLLAGYENSHAAASIGLLYGRASTRAGAARWSAAMGLSVVQVDISGRELRNTVGLPISVHGSLDSLYVGIGIGAFANVNTAESYGGAVVTLRLGRLL